MINRKLENGEKHIQEIHIKTPKIVISLQNRYEDDLEGLKIEESA